jgi:hypothetical protein
LPDVGLITCKSLPAPDPDESVLSQAIAESGMSAVSIPWDDPDIRPADCKLCVFRSCWNYFDEIDAFLEWIDHTERTVLFANSGDIVRWNVHKRYLRSLERQGVPTVPTVFGFRGQTIDLARTMDENGWGEIVVKPAISAGSVRTRRYGPGHLDHGQAFLDTLLAERDVMIQPFFESVESSDGERAVIGIDGAWTHTVRKAARFEGDVQRVSEGFRVGDEEAAVAETCLAALPEPVFYVRIDLMRDAEGTLRVSEIEAIEPTLFLSASPVALQRFVDGMARIVRKM